MSGGSPSRYALGLELTTGASPRNRTEASPRQTGLRWALSRSERLCPSTPAGTTMLCPSHQPAAHSARVQGARCRQEQPIPPNSNSGVPPLPRSPPVRSRDPTGDEIRVPWGQATRLPSRGFQPQTLLSSPRGYRGLQTSSGTCPTRQAALAAETTCLTPEGHPSPVTPQGTPMGERFGI